MPASFILTSSIDFCPKFLISSRSASVRLMSSPTVLTPSRLRQLYDRTVMSRSSIGSAGWAAGRGRGGGWWGGGGVVPGGGGWGGGRGGRSPARGASTE